MRFTIDGREYHAFVSELAREGQVMDGSEAGRTLDGGMDRDIIGTYYNYTMTIDTNALSHSDYDTLFETLTAPQDYHNVSFPYGRSGSLSFRAYVSGVTDRMKKDMDGGREWGDLTCKFVAMKPHRRP